jgi:hypothetical protein
MSLAKGLLTIAHSLFPATVCDHLLHKPCPLKLHRLHGSISGTHGSQHKPLCRFQPFLGRTGQAQPDFGETGHSYIYSKFNTLSQLYQIIFADILDVYTTIMDYAHAMVLFKLRVLGCEIPTVEVQSRFFLCSY